MDKPFLIYKLDAATIGEIVKDPPAPHRHEYEELIILLDGTPEHFIDFRKQTIQSPAIIYVSKGKIHQFMPDLQTRGWLIQYQNEFAPQSSFHFYSNFADTIHYSLSEHTCHNRLDTLCSLIYEDFSANPPRFQVIKHLLLALLTQIDSDHTLQIAESKTVSNSYTSTFDKFLKLVETNYKQDETVQFYADQLNTSARNLNLICRSVFDKSVSEIIEDRKLIEAKQLIVSSDKTISEIGFEVGYNEKSYFTRVFSKREGITPTEFKKKAVALLQ